MFDNKRGVSQEGTTKAISHGKYQLSSLTEREYLVNIYKRGEFPTIPLLTLYRSIRRSRVINVPSRYVVIFIFPELLAQSYSARVYSALFRSPSR